MLLESHFLFCRRQGAVGWERIEGVRTLYNHVERERILQRCCDM